MIPEALNKYLNFVYYIFIENLGLFTGNKCEHLNRKIIIFQREKQIGFKFMCVILQSL